MIKSEYSIMTGMNFYSDVLCPLKEKFPFRTVADRRTKPPKKKRGRK